MNTVEFPPNDDLPVEFEFRIDGQMFDPVEWPES